jgi:RNA polymerase sigma-70 factor (ECF subfamily)
MQMDRAEDNAAFVQLLTAHQGRLYAYALSLLGVPDQARDVMQDTNMVLWQRASDFQLGTNFAAWMLRIAHFQALAYRQRIKRQKYVFDDELVTLLADEAVERDPLIDEQARLLHGCLQRLNDRHRDILRKRYQDDHDLVTIAAQIGRNVNAVKQLLFRARAALVDCVREHGQSVTS